MNLLKDRHLGRVLCTLVFLGVSSGFLSGCKPEMEYGHYEGTLRERTETEVRKIPVKIEMIDRNSDSIKIEIRDVDQNRLGSIYIISESWGKIKVIIPFLNKTPVDLVTKKYTQNDGDWNLLEGKIADYRVDLLYRQESFILGITNEKDHKQLYRLFGEYFPNRPQIEMEKPRNFTLSEAITHAIDRNFESRIEFERVFQAKRATTIAYRNLIPHFGFRTLFSLSNLNPLTFVENMGNFVPFLLPSTWFRAHEAEDLSEAQEITRMIMNADLTSQVETLAYFYERDQQDIRFYKDLLLRITDAYHQVKAGGRKPDLESRLFGIMNQMSSALLNLKCLLSEDRAAISRSLGFQNSETVQDLILDVDEKPIHEVQGLDKREIAKIALDRALEVRQMDFLIHAARQEKNVLYLKWVEDGGLLNLRQHFKISNSHIAELEIRRQQAESEVLAKAEVTVEKYNKAIHSYALANQMLDIKRGKMERFLARVTDPDWTGDEYNDLDLEDFFERYIGEQLKVNNLLAEYRMNRSLINRLLLEGVYGYFLTEAEAKDSIP